CECILDNSKSDVHQRSKFQGPGKSQYGRQCIVRCCSGCHGAYWIWCMESGCPDAGFESHSGTVVGFLEKVDAFTGFQCRILQAAFWLRMEIACVTFD